MTPLKASFNEVSDPLILTLIDQAEVALAEWKCRIDTEAFHPSTSLVRFGISLPVISNREKLTLKAIKPDMEEIKEPIALRMWNGRGSPVILATSNNDFDGVSQENIHLIERTRLPTLNNMILIDGKDDQAVSMMTQVLTKLHSATNADSIKGAIRNNSGRASVINQTLAAGVVPETLAKKFERIAMLQEKYIAETLHTQTVVHGRPGPGNITRLDSNWPNYVATSSDALWAPPSSDYAFMFTNPAYAPFLTPERLTARAEIAQREGAPAAQETLNATLIHTAMAICWSGVLNGETPEPAKYASLKYYEQVMESAAQAAGFNLN